MSTIPASRYTGVMKVKPPPPPPKRNYIERVDLGPAYVRATPHNMRERMEQTATAWKDHDDKALRSPNA